MRPCYVYSATVTRVIDADTLVCSIDLGFYVSVQAHIRLKGFDAPEAGTKEGDKATKFVDRLLMKNDNQVVLRTEKDPDRSFARYIAEVYLPNGDSLARRCKQEGHCTR